MITVGQLRKALENFDDAAPVMIEYDGNPTPLIAVVMAGPDDPVTECLLLDEGTYLLDEPVSDYIRVVAGAAPTRA